MEQIRFGSRALTLLSAILVVSVLSGRHFFLDGSYQIISSLNDPFWFPESQPTPRRFFSQMWANGLVRLIGFFSPYQIEPAQLIYGVMNFGLILIGAIALAYANIETKIKYALIALYFGGYMILANFIVSEISLTLSMTTVFVACTFDPERDPSGWRRLAAAVLLFASYEIVAVSNLILAYFSWKTVRIEPKHSRAQRYLPLVLAGGSVFQIVFFIINPLPGNGGADKDPTLYILAILLAIIIVIILFVFKLLMTSRSIRKCLIISAFAFPCILFFIPQSVNFRTDLFQFSYPFRLSTMCVVLVISAAPLLFDSTILRWPQAILNWFGEEAIKDTGLLVFSAFCGLSLLSSLDAIRFFSRLDAELARHEGYYQFDNCAFCQNPEAENTANLGYPWIWKSYSIVISLRHRERPFTIIVHAEPGLDVPSPTLAATMMTSHNSYLSQH